MTNDELMQPRYKVIGPYPDSPFKIGNVLSLPWDNTAYFGIIKDRKYTLPHYVHIKEIKACPNLFKELQWWEDRKPEDMPDYVKDTEKVTKILEWGFIGSLLYGTLRHGDEINSNRYFTTCIPATEQEYKDYLASTTRQD